MAEQRIPPQNVEAEQSVLGSLMLDKNAIIKIVDFLQPQDFYRDTHQNIYKSMVGLFERREPVDILSVTSRLREIGDLEKIGGQAYLAELVNSVPTASSVVHYARIVQRKRILRDLITASYDIAQLGYKEEEDVDVLLDEAEKRVFGISEKSLSQNFIQVNASLEEAFNRIDKLSKHEGETRGVPTGFADLDNYLAGLQKSDLIVLASRPGLGKTSFALDIARNVSIHAKKTVGIFSLEMSQEQLVDRLIASQSDVDLWRIRTGNLSSTGDDNDFMRIQNALGTLSEAPIFVDDTPSPTIIQMRAMARRLQSEHDLGLVIVDYLQLIQPRTISDNMVQQVTEISRSLKALARELNVPVFALSQLSRAVESRSPQIPRLSDLRDSGCLAGDMLITRADTGERIPIKKLAERRIQEPILVMASGGDYKIKPYRMIKVFSSGKKMTYSLKMRSGRFIKASANHPFLKLGGWTRLDHLKVGDKIAQPRNFTPLNPKNKLTDNEVILLAHLLGDGCILPNRPFHYTSADWENIQTVEKSAKSLFNINGRVVKQKNWWHIYLPSPYRLTHNVHNPITNWFSKLNIKLVRSYEKKIPESIFQCDNSKIALFLKHLWATDGNLSWKRLHGRKLAGAIYYATSSPTLAEQVQHLLLRLNIQSSLRSVSSKKYRTMYHICVESSPEQLKFLKKIGIAGERKKIIAPLVKSLSFIRANTNVDVIPKEAWQTTIVNAKNNLGIGWRTVSQYINVAYNGSALHKNGIGRERMSRLAVALESPKLHNLANSDIFWDKIVEIKKLHIEKVYDATVEGAHNFVANDIIVHNSIEQDADVVLFIYRQDKDKDDSPKKNVAEIHIAKHRNGPLGKVQLYFDERRVSFKDLAKNFD